MTNLQKKAENFLVEITDRGVNSVAALFDQMAYHFITSDYYATTQEIQRANDYDNILYIQNFLNSLGNNKESESEALNQVVAEQRQSIIKLKSENDQFKAKVGNLGKTIEVMEDTIKTLEKGRDVSDSFIKDLRDKIETEEARQVEG